LQADLEMMGGKKTRLSILAEQQAQSAHRKKYKKRFFSEKDWLSDKYGNHL